MPTPPSPDDDEVNLESFLSLVNSRKNALLMLAAAADDTRGNIMLAIPPGALATDPSVIPALCDDGASFGVSCTRSMEGAVPGSFNAGDAETLSVGNKNAGLCAVGSYLFVLERCCS